MKDKKNLLEKNKKEEGITLVALVITVIIMLILAAVSISAVIGGEGLFSKIREATEIYENAVEGEEDKIQNLMNQVDRYIENPSNPILKEPAVIGTVVSENQTFDGRLKGTYNNPIIPKGFAPINENGADWGTEEGYKYGLVITDEITGNESTGNEFVWVPVDGEIVKFERYDFGKMSSKITSFNELTETLPTALTESVKNNGGFYIARFEAGISEDMPQEELSSDSSATYGTGTYKPVSKQEAIVWNYIQWGDRNDDTNPGNGAVTVARSMYPENDTNYGAVSTLIYGAQWDTALKFIEAYDIGEAGFATYATNSDGMGNYHGVSGADIFSGVARCGAAEEFKQKNIYDMAGNVYERTMEKYGEYRISRGDDYLYGTGAQVPAAQRASWSLNEHSDIIARF